MKFAYLASVASAALLCGDWAQLYSGKFELSNKCCVNQNSTASPPVCIEPLAPDTSSLISQEIYRFAGDGLYSMSLMIATGQSGPLDYTTGTVLFIVDTQGTYTVQGNNTEVGGEWKKVVYTPKTFTTTITKTNKPNFFTAGQLVGQDIVGPCLSMVDYLNNADYGCPCNGTWTSGGISAGMTTAANTRVVNVSSCPMVNGTNGSMVSSCPENFFFNRAPRYGNVRVTNQTNTSRLLELTQPQLDMEDGYNTTVVYANYTANFSCPSVLNPTPAQSSAGSVAASLVLASALSVAVLF